MAQDIAHQAEREFIRSQPVAKACTEPALMSSSGLLTTAAAR